MEKLVMIKEQFPVQERSYEDRNGQMQVFASKGFVLTDGVDTFYAEAVGDYARGLQALPTDVYHTVQCQMAARDFKDKNGVVRYQTEIRIIKIS